MSDWRATLRPLWRRLPFSLRRSLGAQARESIARSRAQAFPGAIPDLRRPADRVDILGLFSAPLGVGVGAILLARELEASGVSVRRIDAAPRLGTPQDQSPTDQAPPPPFGAPAPLIVALNPPEAALALNPSDLIGRRVIGYWLWELASAPPAWRPLGANWVHEIWTCSAHAAEAMTDFGRPVRIVPLAAALAAPTALTPAMRAAARARLGISDNTFVALTSFAFSSSVARKNPFAAIAAMQSAFAGQSSAKLLIRTLFAERHPEARAALLQAAAAAGSMVQVLEDQPDLASMHALYAAADVYLSLHRAEGFGLNLAEAMLLGLPTVATNWSGNLAFQDDACAALIPMRLVDIRDPNGPYGSPGAVWAEPDIPAAAAALKRLSTDLTFREALGAAGRTAALDRLSGGAAGRALRLQSPEDLQ